MVVAGRCCWPIGAEEGTVGRVGALVGAGARPADLLRGIFGDVVVVDVVGKGGRLMEDIKLVRWER